MTTTTDTTPPPDLQLLKTDARFRVRTPPAQRDALLDLYERGTLTAKAFAAEHGIKYPTFAVWVQQRRKRSQTSVHPPGLPSDGSPLRWVEAMLPQLPTSDQGACCLEFPQGITLTLSHESQLPLAVRLISLLASTQSSTNSQPHLYA
jgi:transposase-like protein